MRLALYTRVAAPQHDDMHGSCLGALRMHKVVGMQCDRERLVGASPAKTRTKVL